jgi:hypothetical protein
MRIFTKKDNRTALDVEIDCILDLLSEIKPYPKEDNRTNLEKEIDSVLSAMKYRGRETKEYTEMAKNLELLYKAKANDTSKAEKYTQMVENLDRLCKAKISEIKKREIPWKEITVGVFALVQIFMIIRHEDINIITSKALGFVGKGRV